MSFEKDPFNVIIGGVGGQGNVLASQIIGHILVSQGYVITIGETYGASQRGGAVMSHLRISARDHLLWSLKGSVTCWWLWNRLKHSGYWATMATPK